MESKNCCSICSCPFDVDSEGGISGIIGTFITVELCPTCYSGMIDMFEQTFCSMCEFKENKSEDLEEDNNNK